MSALMSEDEIEHVMRDSADAPIDFKALAEKLSMLGIPSELRFRRTGRLELILTNDAKKQFLQLGGQFPDLVRSVIQEGNGIVGSQQEKQRDVAVGSTPVKSAAHKDAGDSKLRHEASRATLEELINRADAFVDPKKYEFPPIKINKIEKFHALFDCYNQNIQDKNKEAQRKQDHILKLIMEHSMIKNTLESYSKLNFMAEYYFKLKEEPQYDVGSAVTKCPFRPLSS